MTKGIPEYIAGDVALLNAVIESAIDGIIVIDEKGVIELVNPATLSLFGYDEEELLGSNISKLMPEPDKSRHDDYLRHYLKTGHKSIIGIGREVLGKKKSGEEFPFKLSVSEAIVQGKRYFSGVVHDITNIKKAERQLRLYANKLEQLVSERTQDLKEAMSRQELVNKELQSEIRERENTEIALLESQQLYGAIASNFPNGIICVFDTASRYVFYDGKELESLHMNSAQLIGKQPSAHLPQKSATAMEQNIDKALNGEMVNFELSVVDRIFSCNAVPLKDLTGRINLVLVVVQDITNRKLAEIEVKRSLEKERELNELKSRFVTMASHEFRTPLSTILSSVALIAKYKEASQQEKREKHVERIKSNINNLTQILNDFLSLGRLEEGKISYKPEPFDLNNLLRTVKEEMQQMAKPGQKIYLEAPHFKNKAVYDPHVLKNVLNNLVSNAIKYSDDNTEIELKAAQEEDLLKIIIKDQGFGISEEDKQHLFERFFRANNVLNIQGTGLGLNIVKKYVDMMDGTVDFESTLNVGSEFSIVLPSKFVDTP